MWKILTAVCFAAFTLAAEVRFRPGVVDENAGTGGSGVTLAGDLNGDGLADLVVAAKGGEVIWFENPSLKRRQIYKAPFRWSCEGRIADIDRDNDNDIVLLSGSESKHYWLENPGPPGGDWKLHEIGAGIMGHGVEVADLDGDGRLEVIVRGAGEVQIWKQEGPDRWTKTAITTTEGSGVKAADVDRDRDIDIVIGGRWYENGANWAERIIDPKAAIHNRIEFADLNGDYRKDIIVTPSETHDGSKERAPVVWYEAPADAKKEPWAKHIVDKDKAGLHTLSLADFDLDGNLDIVTGETTVYLNHNKGEKWTSQKIAGTGAHQGFAFDLGGDGDYDLIGSPHDSNRIDLWENVAKTPGARSFVFFDGLVTHAGKRRLWENWDFVMKLPVYPGAPRNWLSPVNFVDGKLKFEVQVLEMSPVEAPVSVHMGWWNLDDDPEIRHTAGAPILFNKPGTYATVVPIRSIRAFYGAGPRENAIVKDWNWHDAYTAGRFYTFIQPKENQPGKDGFPYRIRATVTIYAEGEKP